MRKLLWLLALAACTPKPQYPECKTDPDCAEHGQVCLSGFCKECREDSNCAGKPDKPVGRDAICVAKPQCAKNEDCAAGLKCAQEKCVPECSDATAPHACPHGQNCIAR